MATNSAGFTPLRLTALIFLCAFNLMLAVIPSDPFSSSSNIGPALLLAIVISIAAYYFLSQLSETASASITGQTEALSARILGVHWRPGTDQDSVATETGLLAALTKLESKNIAANLDEKPGLHYEYIPPGAALSGFTSVEKALRYLNQHPTETAWVMNRRSGQKGIEQQQQPLLAIALAGPASQPDQPGIARLGLHAVGTLSQPGSPAVQTWLAAISRAAVHADVSKENVSYLVYDKTMDAPSNLLEQLSGAMAILSADVTPEKFDLDKNGFNTPALPGDAGSEQALLSIALATAHAYHTSQTVVVASTRDPNRAIALVVTPPTTIAPASA